MHVFDCRPRSQQSHGEPLEVHETVGLERDELVALLKTVNDVNKARGGCQFVCKVTFASLGRLSGRRDLVCKEAHRDIAILTINARLTLSLSLICL